MTLQKTLIKRAIFCLALDYNGYLVKQNTSKPNTFIIYWKFNWFCFIV